MQTEVEDHLSFFHAFKIIFLCDLLGGEAKTSDETEDVAFFNIDELPELSQNRTNAKHISVIKQHLNEDNCPAFFD